MKPATYRLPEFEKTIGIEGIEVKYCQGESEKRTDSYKAVTIPSNGENPKTFYGNHQMEAKIKFKGDIEREISKERLRLHKEANEIGVINPRTRELARRNMELKEALKIFRGRSLENMAFANQTLKDKFGGGK